MHLRKRSARSLLLSRAPNSIWPRRLREDRGTEHHFRWLLTRMILGPRADSFAECIRRTRDPRRNQGSVACGRRASSWSFASGPGSSLQPAHGVASSELAVTTRGHRRSVLRGGPQVEPSVSNARAPGELGGHQQPMGVRHTGRTDAVCPVFGRAVFRAKVDDLRCSPRPMSVVAKRWLTVPL